jgi:flagellar hook-associated protein 3 FlgL
MTTARITQRQSVATSLAALQLGMSRLAKSQEKMSTGRNINRPSDSPTGTNDAMRLRAALAAKAQYSANAQDGASWLGNADSTLTSMLDEVRRARDLVVQGSSTGNSDSDAREALAQAVTQIRAGLLSEANTQYLGRPLFGGTTASTTAYDSTGTYVGDGNDVNRTVGDGISIAVNVTGPKAFSSGSDNLFGVLDDIVTQLRTDPASLSTSLTRLDAVTGSMKTALSDVGARENRVDTAMSNLDSATLDTKSALSNVEDVDIASATMDLQMQEVAYQASLAATARVIQPSLVDFLK